MTLGELVHAGPTVMNGSVVRDEKGTGKQATMSAKIDGPMATSIALQNRELSGRFYANVGANGELIHIVVGRWPAPATMAVASACAPATG